MYQGNLNMQNTKRVRYSINVVASENDRMSSLPTELVHYIMTFLPTRYVTRTSALSKKFNALCKSFSTIELNENEHLINALKENPGDVPRTRNKFFEHMQTCYKRHDLRFVEKLRILAIEPVNSDEENNITPLVDSFLFAAIEGGGVIKEMDLEFPVIDEPPVQAQNQINLDAFYDSFYRMPEVAFFDWCRSLRRLKLEGCSFEEFGNEVPNIELPSVKDLYIRNCVMSDDFMTGLIHGSPGMEALSLKFNSDVEVIRFSHSKLKTLIVGCHDSTVVFQIDAPNLVSFKFSGTYSQHAHADPLNEVRFKTDHVINAPNLETFILKYASVDMASIQMALTKFKNLKEIVMNHCNMETAPDVRGRKIEVLAISNCEFENGGLLLNEAKLPVLDSVSINTCTGLEWLSIKSTTVEELILQECIGLEEWVICAPNVTCLRRVNLGN